MHSCRGKKISHQFTFEAEILRRANKSVCSNKQTNRKKTGNKIANIYFDRTVQMN